jgi:hypothetical protein
VAMLRVERQIVTTSGHFEVRAGPLRPEIATAYRREFLF